MISAQGKNENNTDKKSRESTDNNKDSILDINQVNGIGKKTKNRILEHYKSNENAINAISRGLTGILPGISFKQACNFAISYFEQKHTISKKNVLKTKDIEQLYENLIKKIKAYANTEYAKNIIRFYYPLSSKEHHTLHKRRRKFANALEFFNKYKDQFMESNIPALLSNLGNLQLETPQIFSNQRIFITESKDIIQQLETLNIAKNITYERIKMDDINKLKHQFERYAENFEVIIYAGNRLEYIPDLPNLICFSPNKITKERLIPEATIQFFSDNSSIINSMIQLSKFMLSLEDKSIVEEFSSVIELKKIDKINDNIRLLDNKGNIIEGYNKQLDKARDIENKYLDVIGETEAKINEVIEKDIGQRSIEISGKKILDLFQSDISVEHIRDYIPEEVHDFILDTIYKYLEQLKKTLGLDKNQMRYVNDLEPESIEYPIELNEHGVSQLHHRISAQANVINFDLLMDISRKLSSLKQYILELYETFLEFDLFCTIGYFAYEYQLSIPTFIKDRNGFYGNNMRNLELMEEMPVEMVEPIQYQIGEIVPQKLNEEIKKARLNLLTGSNSGGKTICIKTCAEGLMLAQMGFPSLGDLTLSPFDEIYYFKKSNGQISAGAFETTLIQFVEMAQSNKKKIIFADELESITEPSAASRVLSGIFSLLLKNPLNYGVFVTHLVEMIREELREDDLRNIRIDGIEAKGLDKDLELMVDRTPKFSFIARSTPELILSRLSKLGSRQQKDFFDSLLKKF